MRKCDPLVIMKAIARFNFRNIRTLRLIMGKISVVGITLLVGVFTLVANVATAGDLVVEFADVAMGWQKNPQRAALQKVRRKGGNATVNCFRNSARSKRYRSRV